VLETPDKSACFYKSPDWKYEHEWRCVREFDRSEHRLVTIEPTLITQIVLGHQMDPWQIARVALYAKEHEMNCATFFQSSPVHKAWNFVMKPKAISLCECCGGDGYVMKDLD
jgi:hypothetical protein